MEKQATPLMRQYFTIKEQYPDTLLLFQVGDFYEIFFDDAKKAAAILGIALTKRGSFQGEPIPLCGVPLHVKDHYIAKLVRTGLSIAVCDQLEPPKPGTVVKRGVTQVLTPGTLTDTKLLDEKSASYLGVVMPQDDSYLLVFAELLTGHLSFCRTSLLEAELQRFMPDELLVPDDRLALVLKKQGFVVTSASFAEADEAWLTQLKAPEEARYVLGILYGYLSKTNEQALQQLKQLVVYGPQEYLMLDAMTQRNLELVRNSQDGSSAHSLFSVLDEAKSPMGSRMLKKWLLRPLLERSSIEERLEAVGTFVADHGLRRELRKQLPSLGDLERIVGRIALQRAHVHDYASLRSSLYVVPQIAQILHGQQAPLLQSIVQRMGNFQALQDLLIRGIHDEPGTDWLVKDGYSQELDKLRGLVHLGAQAIAALEAKEQQRTGIASLKIKYNQVHGYGIEVTKPNLHLVPEGYIRVQTLSNRERFTTQELKDLEHDLARAKSEINHVEQELFAEIKKQVEAYIPALKKLAYGLAYVDGLGALAEVAASQGYVRPRFHESRDIIIEQGRHPVVEKRLAGRFIPNDVGLTDQAALWLITGPNMGGKSTFLRQVALIVLMAQVGSFVPASKAQLPLVDRIFTRIGAADNVAEGKSTFLVEMEETAIICNEATDKSLIILDEVGRGTSTFDGLAIAQAVVEDVYTRVRARCLFATHYHELTSLSEKFPGIGCYYAASTKTNDGIVLLHKIMAGIADGSFGLEVAALAGLPSSVVERARQVAQELITNGHQHPMPTVDQQKNDLECYITQELEQIDGDAITAKEALEVVWRLKQAMP